MQAVNRIEHAKREWPDPIACSTRLFELIRLDCSRTTQHGFCSQRRIDEMVRKPSDLSQLMLIKFRKQTSLMIPKYFPSPSSINLVNLLPIYLSFSDQPRATFLPSSLKLLPCSWCVCVLSSSLSWLSIVVWQVKSSDLKRRGEKSVRSHWSNASFSYDVIPSIR